MQATIHTTKSLKWFLFLFFALFILISDKTFAEEERPALYIPRGVKVIEEEAFCGDTSLDTVVLPEGVLSIGPRAFADSSLQLIILPSTLDDIADDAIGRDVRVIASPGTTAYNWALERGYLLPEENAASDFQYTIQNGVCTITKYLGTEETVVVPSRIEDCPVTALGNQAFLGKKSIRYVSLPDSISVIGQSVFSKCSNMVAIDLPDSVTDIGVYAFSECASLSCVRLPQLQVLNTCLFQGCSSLRELEIPSGVTAINGGAFKNSGIESILLPDSVTLIEGSAFSGCANLKSVVIPSGVRHLKESLFENCVSLESISIPDTIEGFYGNVFSGCSALEHIELPENSHIYTSSSYIFYGCTSLREIVLPVSSAIPPHAFDNCRSLESVRIPDSATIIEDSAFNMCVSLNTVTFGPNSKLFTIADRAFAYCTSLSRIELPQSCRVVKEKAFYGCYNLESFSYNERYEVSDYVARYGVVFPAYYYIGLGSETVLPVHFLDGEEHDYTLSSSNESIISVSGQKIKGVAGGHATVYLTIPHMRSGGKDYVKSISVYVGLELNKNEITLESGKSAALEPTYDVFLESTYPFITGEERWSSSDRSVATVDDKGNVTGHLMGEAVVTLSVPTNAGTMSASCTVTVVPDQNTLDQIIQSVRYTWTENADEYTVSFTPIEESQGMTFSYALFRSDSMNGTYELADNNAVIRPGEGSFAPVACPRNAPVYLRILVSEFSNGFPVRVRFTNPVFVKDPAYDPVVYRGLLIGEPNAMNGDEVRFKYDALYLTAILHTLNDGTIETFGSPYLDLTEDEAKQLIDNSFKSATDNDVSIFYISTHGVGVNGETVSKGDLTMVHNQSYLRLQDLGTKINNLKGIKIVIIEACLSGMALQQETFHDDSIILFTASNEVEESHGGAMYPNNPDNPSLPNIFKEGNYFSNDIYNTLKDFTADNNPQNGIITPRELIDYVTEKTSSNSIVGSHPQSLCPTQLENYPLFWK